MSNFYIRQFVLNLMYNGTKNILVESGVKFNRYIIIFYKLNPKDQFYKSLHNL